VYESPKATRLSNDLRTDFGEGLALLLPGLGGEPGLFHGAAAVRVAAPRRSA
jgi:hypothetical protein